MDKYYKKIKRAVGIFAVPVVLLFTFKSNINIMDRFHYLWETLLRFSPFLLVYNFFSNWCNSNEVFAIGLATALSVNLITGARYHWLKKTFSIEKMLTRNIEILMTAAIVYVLLQILVIPLDKSFIGIYFKNTIEFITILFPASKAIKSVFILSGGKHPPKFIMTALYQYEKDGKLKDFFDNINGNEKDGKLKDFFDNINGNEKDGKLKDFFDNINGNEK